VIQNKNHQQLALFQTPFEQSLDPNNRWVRLAHFIAWEELAPLYEKQMDAEQGTPAKDARLILGAVIIKHKENLTDEDTIDAIKENVYMQYFVGLSSFKTEKIFEPSLFVAIRKRLNPAFWNKLNEIIISTSLNNHISSEEKNSDNNEMKKFSCEEEKNPSEEKENAQEKPVQSEVEANEGELLLDATVAPQDIAYPNDLNLVNESRVKADQLITLVCLHSGEKKPRTYNRVARKNYLSVAKKKNRSSKEIHKAVGKQLRYLKRNLSYLKKMFSSLGEEELKKIFSEKDFQYYSTIQKVYEQQTHMHDTKTHSVENRIVSIHQPHVRPMVRGKAGSDVEFGSKMDVSLHNGFARIEKLDWNNYHEASTLPAAAENYLTRYGFYPKKIIVDRKYCTRENRSWCKERNIHLSAKPLGRPTAQTQQQIRELKKDSAIRNSIEGKFGQGKRSYGLDLIKAKLQTTSESWLGAIICVLNLVKWEQLFSPFYFLLLLWKNYVLPVNKKTNQNSLYATF